MFTVPLAGGLPLHVVYRNDNEDAAVDYGVALARRLHDDPARFARALTDRSMFLVAARTFEPTHADFAEATALLHDH
ncbi:hypothetical protein AB0940_34460 [Streptomyces sp. NPDC006656]|uniref:hypothetical protein n=1 Tax=Streptomyces sp. NPDC006656 TaxID=3156899 RepID=UPI003452F67A